MTRVELIYDLDCPNVRQTRKALLQAFAEAEIPASWTEWDRKSPESPPYVRQYGSPTVLVNNRDVTGRPPAESGDSCRIYGQGANALSGVPPVGSIVTALRNAAGSAEAAPNNKALRWRQALSSLPGIGTALLPIGGCPACWPVYSGVLGALGLTFLLNATYLLWISSALMGVALLALAYRAQARRSYGPLVLGGASVGLILFFKFSRPFDLLVYTGLGGLVIASVWNAWPEKGASVGACPHCSGAEPTGQTTNTP
jgi:hypothetical protein